MKADSDPSHPQEFDGMSLSERSFWLSRAFIEAGRRLCTDMLEGEFSSQYSSSRVVLHLARQGVELFLKAAISAVGQVPYPSGHNLQKLLAEYRTVCPGVEFHFSLPTSFLISPNRDLFEDYHVDPDYFHATLDQRHRYPADKLGNVFSTPEVFDPTETLEELDELSRCLGIIEYCEVSPILAARGTPRRL